MTDYDVSRKETALFTVLEALNIAEEGIDLYIKITTGVTHKDIEKTKISIGNAKSRLTKYMENKYNSLNIVDAGETVVDYAKQKKEDSDDRTG